MQSAHLLLVYDTTLHRNISRALPHLLFEDPFCWTVKLGPSHAFDRVREHFEMTFHNNSNWLDIPGTLWYKYMVQMFRRHNYNVQL